MILFQEPEMVRTPHADCDDNELALRSRRQLTVVPLHRIPTEKVDNMYITQDSGRCARESLLRQ